jgi:hypothetical protein
VLADQQGEREGELADRAGAAAARSIGSHCRDAKPVGPHHAPWALSADHARLDLAHRLRPDGMMRRQPPTTSASMKPGSAIRSLGRLDTRRCVTEEHDPIKLDSLRSFPPFPRSPERPQGPAVRGGYPGVHRSVARPCSCQGQGLDPRFRGGDGEIRGDDGEGSDRT